MRYRAYTAKEVITMYANEPIVAALAEAYTRSVDEDAITAGALNFLLEIKKNAVDGDDAVADLRWIGKFILDAADRLDLPPATAVTK
jgi:hypothetical protein